MEIKSVNIINQNSPFLNVEAYAAICKYVLNDISGKLEFVINPLGKENYVCIKIDCVTWVNYLTPILDKFNLKNVTLFVCNGDLPFCSKQIELLNDDRIDRCFAQNADLIHKKLIPVPIGIAHHLYNNAHGNIQNFNKVQSENNIKDNLIYANFSVNTNAKERCDCLLHTKMKLVDQEGNGWHEKSDVLEWYQPKSHESYLRDLSKSYYCLSPRGNGIDCHRTWESLYMRCIPIVTRNLVTESHSYLPIIILDSWEDFKIEDYTIDKYHEIMKNFEVSNLYAEKYFSDRSIM